MDFKHINFEAVLFDMDGVLVNSEPFYTEVEQQIFRMVGLNISPGEHVTYQGTATDRMWNILKPKYNLPHTVEELVRMNNEKVIPYFLSMETISPMPGVRKLIQHYQDNNIPFALASSSTPDVIRIVLEKTGLQKYFGVVVDSQMAGSSKPDPDIFLLAAKKLGIAPQKCLVIEDSTNGIKAAKLAGMSCIAYAGPGSEHQNQSEADFVISDFNELIGPGVF